MGSASRCTPELASVVTTKTAIGARRRATSGSEASAVSATPPAVASSAASIPTDAAKAATARPTSISRSLRLAICGERTRENPCWDRPSGGVALPPWGDAETHPQGVSRTTPPTDDAGMSALTRWVLAHKRIVALSWLALTIAGIAAAGPASRALDPEFSVPNKEGWETNVAIQRHYRGTGGEARPLLPVVTLPKGTTVLSPGVRADLARLDARLERALPGARVASYVSTGDPAFVSRDRRTTFALVYPTPDRDATFGENPGAEKAARAALAGATVAGAHVHLTGFDALQLQSGGGDGPGVLLEALLGAAGALAVLTFVFASFLAVVP